MPILPPALSEHSSPPARPLVPSGSNLLISNDGHLKLADFGLARPFDTDQQRPYTNRVITLWYRPPELLLGATMYGPAIDMWSAGCIFAELLLRKPILPGKNEFEQIDLIFRLLGTPDDTTWPKVSKLQYYDMILSQNGGRKYASRFEDKFAALQCPHAKDLLRKLLAMDPAKRISADDALDHEYFWSDPPPATPEMLPKYPPSHEFTAKKRRQQEAKQQQQQQGASAAQQGGGGGLPVAAHNPHGGAGYHPQHHYPPHQMPHPAAAPAYAPPAAYAGGGGPANNATNNPFYAARASAQGGGPPGGGGYPPPQAGAKRGFFDGSQQGGGGSQQYGGHRGSAAYHR